MYNNNNNFNNYNSGGNPQANPGHNPPQQGYPPYDYRGEYPAYDYRQQYYNEQPYYPPAQYGAQPGGPLERYYAERKELKTLSNVAGICMLAFVLIQAFIGFVIGLYPPFRNVYFANVDFQNAVGIIFSVCGVLLPFVFGALYLKGKQGTDLTPVLDPPADKKLALLLIPVGFALCVAASYISGFLTDLIERTGIELIEPETSVPGSRIGWVIYFIAIAVVPPVTEEFAVRGVVMQPLRKYGDVFAIVISSFVFGIMHGNLIQTPFAFMAGAAIGYVMCKTNSLWPGIVIHLLNNGFSVGIEFLLKYVTTPLYQNIIYYGVLAAIIICAVISAVILVKTYGSSLKIKTNKLNTLTAGSKVRAYIITIPMLLAIAAMFYITSKYVSF